MALALANRHHWADCKLGSASVCSLQVVVIEKGRYTKAADLTLLERDAFQNMYEGCGLATTDDAGELWAYHPLPAAVTTQHPDLHLLPHLRALPLTQAPCTTELMTTVQASISWLEQLWEEEPASTGMSVTAIPAACLPSQNYLGPQEQLSPGHTRVRGVLIRG